MNKWNRKKCFLIVSYFLFNYLIEYILKKEKSFYDELIFFQSFNNLNQTSPLFNDIKNIHDFALLNSNKILLEDLKKIKKFNKPKISIIITVYNTQAFLATAFRSIQNQDYKNIEILVIDDNSQDGSSRIIKKYMSEDKRIILMKNTENKGALYSKSLGVLYAMGKYVMTLDSDDLYANKNAFSILYNECEKNNLDILGFGSLFTDLNFNFTKSIIYNYIETEVLYQPIISQILYYHPRKGNFKIRGYYIWCYLFKTELFVNVINSINKQYFNRIMNWHDDLLLLLPLTRKAKKFKNIKKIFHLYVNEKKGANSSLIYAFLKDKDKRVSKYNCLANIYFADFLLENTYNTIFDKQISTYKLKDLILNNKCGKNSLIKSEIINLLHKFLKNNYITFKIKKDIKKFMNKQVMTK